MNTQRQAADAAAQALAHAADHYADGSEPAVPAPPYPPAGPAGPAYGQGRPDGDRPRAELDQAPPEYAHPPRRAQPRQAQARQAPASRPVPPGYPAGPAYGQGRPDGDRPRAELDQAPPEYAHPPRQAQPRQAQPRQAQPRQAQPRQAPASRPVPPGYPPGPAYFPEDQAAARRRGLRSRPVPPAGHDGRMMWQPAAVPAARPRRPSRRARPLPGGGDDAAGLWPLRPPRRGRRKVPEYDPGLAAQGIYDNLVITGSHVIAWFVLPAEPWSFRPPAQRESVITGHAARMAQMVGRRCYIRVTSRPFPVRDWAASFDRSIRERHEVMPGPCVRHPYRSEDGCPDCVQGHAWFDWLRDQQLRVHGWGTDDKIVYFGVELDGRAGLSKLLARVSRRAAGAELGGFAEKLREVSAAVGGAGMRGLPATPSQMQWLMARSCWLHMPAPRRVSERPDVLPYVLPDSAPRAVGRAGLAQLTDGISWTAEPFGRTVTITRPDGLTRYVAVLTVAEGMAGEDAPGDSPWLQRTDLLPFPVEWMVTIDIRDRKEVAREMHRRITEIKHQAGHYAEHGQSMPPGMNRQYDAARRLEDEAENSPQALAGRTRVWARVAVGGATVTEALTRAGQVAEQYSPAVPIVQPPDQYKLAREFIPGEPLSSIAHCRYMPAKLLAAGMPNATARIGRLDGFPVGRTVSLSSRAVTLHPWREMEERHRSGLTVVTGTLGSGKSTFGGSFAYMAVRAGIATVIMDPSGLLDSLCAMPELAAHSRAVNLLQAPAGTLCPYGLIADPRREDFGFDERGRRQDADTAARQWREACQAAAVTRQELVKEILRMLLPAEMRGKAARVVLSKAASMVPATVMASPRDVLTAMRTLGDDYGVGHDGVWLADQLEELTSHPWARLFFPPADGSGADEDIIAADRLLTVMTLRGIVVPGSEVAPEQYTVEQRLSVPLMHLAAWLTRRHVMDRPRHVRKLTILDEAHQVTFGAVGQALVNETARDSRKHNHCAIFMSQRPQDLQIADVDNLIGMTMAGRTEGAEEQAATLGLLGLPAGRGYEGYLSALSQDAPGQFMVNDGTGLEVIQVDLLGVSESLRAALDSTPTGQAPTRAGRQSAPSRAGPARTTPAVPASAEEAAS